MDPAAAHRVETALTTLITDQGRVVLSRPARLHAGLADLLGADRTDTGPYVDALVALAQAGETTALQSPEPNLTGVTDTMRQTRPDLDPDAAWWAARTVHSLIAPPPPGPTRLGDAGEQHTALSSGSSPTPPGSGPAAPPGSRPPPRHRWTRPLVAAIALLAVAGASAGITYAGTRSPEPSAASGSRAGAASGSLAAAPARTVTEVTASTTTATLTTTKTASVTTRQRITTVVTRVSTVDPLAAHQKVICKPGMDAISSALKAINSWAAADDDDTSAARQSRQGLIAAATKLDRLVSKVSGRADSAITVTAGQLSVAYRDLAVIVAAGGTSSYSVSAWNAAMVKESWIQDGFYAVCYLGGSATAKTDAAAVNIACGVLAPRLDAADRALSAWRSAPGGSTAGAFRQRTDKLSDALGDIRYGGLLYTTPLGYAVSMLGYWQYNLSEAAKNYSAQQPPSSWVSGWARARDLARAACG